jgi:hypothetical protein
MGSPNEFGWLSVANVTSHQKATEIPNEIPLRLRARDFSSLFARKNFDFAQDDIQWFCLIIIVRCFAWEDRLIGCFVVTVSHRKQLS